MRNQTHSSGRFYKRDLQLNFSKTKSAIGGNFFRPRQIIVVRGNVCVGGAMIDSLFNVATFVVLVARIVGFGVGYDARLRRREEQRARSLAD
jgi:hypothetical protein